MRAVSCETCSSTKFQWSSCSYLVATLLAHPGRRPDEALQRWKSSGAACFTSLHCSIINTTGCYPIIASMMVQTEDCFGLVAVRFSEAGVNCVCLWIHKLRPIVHNSFPPLFFRSLFMLVLSDYLHHIFFDAFGLP